MVNLHLPLVIKEMQIAKRNAWLQTIDKCGYKCELITARHFYFTILVELKFNSTAIGEVEMSENSFSCLIYENSEIYLSFNMNDQRRIKFIVCKNKI